MWGIVLHRSSEMSLSRQIFLFFKEHILRGEILQGEVLPSTRELATELGVSRNTVCEAYDMLWTEGFIVRRQGAPSRVAEDIFIIPKKSEQADEEEEKKAFLWDFKTGQPDLSAFPWQLWSQMMREAADNVPSKYLAYTGAQGYLPLCEAISHWLLRSRGMQVNAKDIFITSGAMEALYLSVEILHKKEHSFALEDPSHPGIGTVIADKGYAICWMPVDSQGADIESLQGRRLSGVYTTPSHQFPLGTILPAGRRAQLIRLAIEKDFYIIEDDYDSEFRYTGPAVSPIYSMEPSRVIYVGTFSKTLFPALRIGFAVVPRPLQKKWQHCRSYMDVQNAIFEQMVLAKFLDKRKMDKHLQRMRKLYGEKRNTVIREIEQTIGSLVYPWGDTSGLHVALQFPKRKFDEQFIRKCTEEGIRIRMVSQYCHDKNNHEDKLLIGYGHLSINQIQEGIKVLQKLL